MTGFYCSKCNHTYPFRPEDGVCPKCPAEPLYDLSNVKERALAYIAEEEEPQLVAQAGAKRGALAAAACAAIAFVGVMSVAFSVDGDAGGLLFFVALFAAAIAGSGGYSLAQAAYAKGRVGSNLPAEQASSGGTCASCGSIDLAHPTPDAYRCGTCEYEGGPGWARIRRERELQKLATLSPAEQKRALALILRDALRALEGIGSKLAGPREYLSERVRGRRRPGDHTSNELQLVTRDAALVAVGVELSDAQMTLDSLAHLLEEPALKVDLLAQLEEILAPLTSRDPHRDADETNVLAAAVAHVGSVVAEVRTTVMKVAGTGRVTMENAFLD